MTKMKKVFILAAGQGKRLLPLTEYTPKCLVNVNGTTILEYQLVTMASVGVKEVVLIGGFEAQKLKSMADHYVALHGLDLRIKLIYNKDYAITNNLFSLWLAKEEMTSDFMVINGDNVFDRKAMIKVIQSKDAAVLAIHRNDSYDDEDMKVEIRNGRVVGISKQIPNDIANGESMGLRGFRGAGVNAFKNALDQAMIEDVTRNSFFVKAIQRMIDVGENVGYVDVTEYQYGELDFFDDLRHLETELSGMMKQTVLLHTNPMGVFAQTNGMYTSMRMKNAG